MKTTYTYYKNSNTGELIKKQSFSEIPYKQPDYYYNHRNHIIEEKVDLAGYVQITEKKFIRESKRLISKV